MKKVLISRLSSLGDIVLTQPVIEAVAGAGDQVSLLVGDIYKNFAALLPGVDQIIVPDQKIKEPFDLLFDLHKTGRSTKALRNKPVQKKIGYPKYGLARRLLIRPGGKPVFWNRWSTLKGHPSVIDWYKKAAQKAGYNVTHDKPRLSFDNVETEHLTKQLENNGVNFEQPLAVLSPGAKWANKRWPEQYFIELCKELAAKKYQVILIGSHDEFHLCKTIQRNCDKTVISLAGKTTLSAMAWLISKAEFIVSNDSGPLHIAGAVNTKSIAFFGPTVKAFGFMPKREDSIILEVDLPCRPCSLHGGTKCPLGHQQCLKAITPKHVMEAIGQLK